MLVTLELANGIKFGNHNKEYDVKYISNLALKSLVLKSGLASDKCAITVPKVALDEISKLTYLTNSYSLHVYVYLNDQFVSILDGYVKSSSISLDFMVTLNIEAKSGFYLSKPLLPNIDNTCQAQVYSSICSLNPSSFTCVFEGIEIETLTGLIPYDINTTAKVLTIAGVHVDIANKAAFVKKENFELAFIRLDNIFRSKVLAVTQSHIVIDLNYTDTDLVTTFSLTLSCDKTYGECYQKFQNTKNFYGFSTSGKPSKTYNIFTSEALTYCGETVMPEKICSSDNKLLGIEL